MDATSSLFPAAGPNTGRILVLARKSLGGIFVFWDNVARGIADVDVLYYTQGERTGFNASTGEFVVSPFDPLVYVYEQLKRHCEPAHYTVFVANEGFELGFFAWLAPRQPVCFIVHGSHQHSYEPALKYAALVDHFFCVSETAVAYLRARGIAHATFFRYSTFIPSLSTTPKQKKVIYVGRFEADKNISETIELLRFLREHGYAVKMIGGGTLEPEIRMALRPEEVRVGASREEIFRELAEARFLCHNSYVEGLPIIHSEAIHFGLGIICNYVDKSIAEVIGDNLLFSLDRDKLLQRMADFSFRPPSGPPRINNPELNLNFLTAIRSVAARTNERHSEPPASLLDRIAYWPAPSVIRRVRKWRWNRRNRLR
jgi:glycosyltransferase involved in cell wall biosynthesis